VITDRFKLKTITHCRLLLASLISYSVAGGGFTKLAFRDRWWTLPFS